MPENLEQFCELIKKNLHVEMQKHVLIAGGFLNPSIIFQLKFCRLEGNKFYTDSPYFYFLIRAFSGKETIYKENDNLGKLLGDYYVIPQNALKYILKLKQIINDLYN